jgi:hypothetical protein
MRVNRERALVRVVALPPHLERSIATPRFRAAKRLPSAIMMSALGH